MESAFVHISNMSSLMKKEFEPSIKDVIPYLLDALNEKELTDQNFNRNEEEMDITDGGTRGRARGRRKESSEL